MTRYEVFLTEYATKDLFDIYYHVATDDSIEKADKFISEIREACRSLNTLANRGHIPHEFEEINVSAYLEIHHHEYRIIYEIVEKKVLIYAVLHMKRDVFDLLQQRLLG